MIFFYTAYTTIVGLICSVFASFLVPMWLADRESIKVSMNAGVAFIGVVTVLLAAGAYILLGMVFFLFKYDRRPMFSKCLLLPAFLFGTSLTATLYYFLVYRKFVRMLPDDALAR